jgi:hypothetical protein
MLGNRKRDIMRVERRDFSIDLGYHPPKIGMEGGLLGIPGMSSGL